MENLPLVLWADSRERRLSLFSPWRPARTWPCTCPPAPGTRPRHPRPRSRPAELRALRDPARPLVALGRDAAAPGSPPAPRCCQAGREGRPVRSPAAPTRPFRGALVCGPSPCVRSIGEAVFLCGLPRQRAAVPERAGGQSTAPHRDARVCAPGAGCKGGTGLMSGSVTAPTPLLFSLA